MKLRKKSMMIILMMVAVTVVGAVSMCITSKAESVTDNHSENRDIKFNSEQLTKALNVAAELSNKMANTEVNELKNEKDVKLYTKEDGYKFDYFVPIANLIVWNEFANFLDKNSHIVANGVKYIESYVYYYQNKKFIKVYIAVDDYANNPIACNKGVDLAI